MKVSSTNEILPLTGIRFVAVLMIYLYHYSFKLDLSGIIVPGMFQQFFLGVQVFFVLSGFVICYKYFEKSELKKTFILTYYLRRFARIYPLFFFLTTFTFIIFAIKNIHESSLGKEYLLNITFLKGLSSKYFLSGIGPSWSLTVEEIFYFFSPFIFFFIKRKNILFLQVPFWWSIGIIFIIMFSVFPFEGFFQSANFVFFVTFFGRCFEFYLGIYLALYITGMPRSQKWTFPRFSFPLYTYSGFLIMVLTIFLIFEISHYYQTKASEIFIGIFFTNIIFPISVAIFFFGLIKESTLVRKLFSTSIFQLLGKSSYAFFLIHIGVVAYGVQKYVSQNIFILFFVLQLISILIFKAFEKPLNLWIRQLGVRAIKYFIA